MRATYKNVTAIFMASPTAQAFSRATGVKPNQMAAELFTTMDAAPNQQAREAIFLSAMRDAGIYANSLKAFETETDRLYLDMSTPERAESGAQRLADQSRNTPVTWPKESILFLNKVMTQSGLQQGLADRLRAKDQHEAEHEAPAITLNARAQSDGEDQRDVRSALMAAISTARTDTVARLPSEYESPLEDSGDAKQDRMRGHVGLRESVAAAFELHSLAAENADPLDDERLLNMSDSV